MTNRVCASLFASVSCNRIGCGFTYGGRLPGEICGDLTGGTFEFCQQEACSGILTVCVGTRVCLPYCYALFAPNNLSLGMKVGRSENVHNRISKLQCACSEKLVLYGINPEIDSEKEHHRALQKYQKRGEWFDITRDSIAYINKNFVSPVLVGIANT